MHKCDTLPTMPLPVLHDALNTDVQCHSFEESLQDLILTTLAKDIVALSREGTILVNNHDWSWFGEGDSCKQRWKVGDYYGSPYRGDVRQSPMTQRLLAGIDSVLTGQSPLFEIQYACDFPGGQRWFVVRVVPLNRAEGGVIVSRQEVSDRKHLEESLAERLQFEAILAGLSTSFVSPEPRHLEGVLKPLAEFLHVERIVLLEFIEKSRCFVPLCSWTADAFRCSKSLAQGCECMDRHAGVEEVVASCGLNIPLAVRGQVVGALLLFAPHQPMTWPAVAGPRLGFARETLATALLHLRTRRELQLQQDEMAHIGRVAVLSEVSAAISHELNQPLTAMLTNAQTARRLLARPQMDIKEIDEALKDIASDVNRASEIVRRTRALLQKTESDRLPLQMNDVIRELQSIVTAQSNEREATVTFDLTPQLPTVTGIRVQLQQVILNLVSNACEAMCARPHESRHLLVMTSLSPDEKYVIVSVRDTGPPVPDEVFRRMFESFYTSKKSGLGIGLTICRSIIEAHGGRLGATRNSDGRGITVQVSLPHLAA